ncbi:MAG: hypothetical protein HOW97_07670 [Catenulispora sp.]|nr:hypothetical protein [Catenulispora sp.]
MVVRFAVLGPLAVADDDAGVVDLPGALPRAVLAALILHANQPVSVDRLVHAVWGDTAPATVGAALRNHVGRLRHALGDPDGRRIRTDAGAYRIRLDPGELDLDDFEQWRSDGLRAARQSRWDQASDSLARALALWRGEPFADVPALVFDERVRRLREDRRLVHEARMDADLHLGLHREVSGELQALVGAEPLHEPFHRQLMLALYRSGRQAEALETYRSLRRMLVDELGIEPSSDIRELHRRILSADPALDFVAPGAQPRPTARTHSGAREATDGPDGGGSGYANHGAASGTFRPVAQLPFVATGFVGRETHLAAIRRNLAPDRPRTSGTPVVALSGYGGVGKTALAVTAAHRLASSFPDGRLYAGLLGSGDRPRDPHEVIGRWLADLGDDPAAIPADAEAREHRFRSLLTHRRVLLVLDDARDAAQVRPLIPGGGGCAVLVTSRSRLPSLLGAVHVEVGSLPADEALELFTTVVGVGRVTAEPQAVGAILAHCAGMPLALHVAGARLANRPSWTIHTLAERLDVERRRLDELAVGDVAVRAVFRTGYANVQSEDAACARAFTLLGLLPGADVGVRSAAALFEVPVDRAEAALEGLVDAHLVQSRGADRYGVHDLLRLYAAELAEEQLSAADRVRAAERIVLHAAAAALAAGELQVPGRLCVGLPELVGVPPHPAFADLDDAAAWYEAERVNLRALASLGGASPVVDDVLARLPWMLRGFFGLRISWDDWSAFAQTGLAAAERLGSGRHQCLVHSILAFLHFERGDLDQAEHWIRTAKSTASAHGDPDARGLLLEPEAFIAFGRGDPETGRVLVERLLVLQEQRGYVFGQSACHNNLGNAYLMMGEAGRARAHFERGLALCANGVDRFNESYLRCSLGELHLGAHEPDAALEQFAAALGIMRDIRDERTEAYTLDCMGQAYALIGDNVAARASWEAAVEILQRLNHPLLKPVLERMAEVETATGAEGR